MKENSKTLLFILAAIACVALAYYTAPDARDPNAKGSKMGQALLESFDPRAATGIEIVLTKKKPLLASRNVTTQS